jgi:hypothetical protein
MGPISGFHNLLEEKSNSVVGVLPSADCVTMPICLDT